MTASTKPSSFGGVVIDDDGRVLLREPRGHYNHYVWTFAKGRLHAGEAEETAALREVSEEMGIEPELVAPIPGVFRGGTGGTRYWLMRALTTGGPLDDETESVRWATEIEARALIGQSTNELGRTRDLAVLDAALIVWRSSGGAP